jgi:hypothetical protein
MISPWGMRGKGIGFADRPGGACGASPLRALGPTGDLEGPAVQDRSIEFGRCPGLGDIPHTGPIWLAVRGCADKPLAPAPTALGSLWRPTFSARLGPIGPMGPLATQSTLADPCARWAPALHRPRMGPDGPMASWDPRRAEGSEGPARRMRPPNYSKWTLVPLRNNSSRNI